MNREYRCTNPHPARPGNLCDGLLMRTRGPGFNMGAVEVHCKKCRKNVWVETRESYTASSAFPAIQVDNAVTVA